MIGEGVEAWFEDDEGVIELDDLQGRSGRLAAGVDRVGAGGEFVTVGEPVAVGVVGRPVGGDGGRCVGGDGVEVR